MAASQLRLPQGKARTPSGCQPLRRIPGRWTEQTVECDALKVGFNNTVHHCVTWEKLLNLSGSQLPHLFGG